MAKVLITHNDLDGVVCGIIFKMAYPESIVFYEDYKTVDGRLRSTLHDYPGHFLYIADISPQTHALVNKLDMVGQEGVRLLDHHKTALHLNRYSWALVDVGRCGAKLLFDEIGDVALSDVDRENMSEIVNMTNDYDLWIHANPLSIRLNSLLTIYGRDRFTERFLTDSSWMFTKEEWTLLSLEQER